MAVARLRCPANEGGKHSPGEESIRICMFPQNNRPPPDAPASSGALEFVPPSAFCSRNWSSRRRTVAELSYLEAVAGSEDDGVASMLEFLGNGLEERHVRRVLDILLQIFFGAVVFGGGGGALAVRRWGGGRPH